MTLVSSQLRGGGGNRLKLGVFAINGASTIRSLAPDRYQFNWKNSLDVAQTADALGFEAIVPNARFAAMVDPHHESGHIFETFTWASAIASRTKRAMVMSTVHVTNIHPTYAAKAMATIDHVSGGRFALNIVTGWSPVESEMFGFDLLPLGERYAYAEEWIDAVKLLWTREDEFDFDGKYVSVKRGMSQPKPIQKPWPILMNAGASPEGKSFAAKHCDIAFINTTNLRDERGGAAYADYGKIRGGIEDYRRVAREKFGREIQMWVNASIVLGDDDVDAERRVETYVAHRDREHIAANLDRRHRDLTPEDQARLERQFACGGNGHLVVGGPRTVTEELQRLSACGVDGVLCTWIDFQGGVRSFGARVMPLLVEAGLRAP